MKNLASPSVRQDKILASLLGGGLGDAQGAPLEGERNFDVLYKKFGPRGVKDFVAPISPLDEKSSFLVGDTTDDTASVIGTSAALVLSEDNTLLHHLWQASVIWNAHQKDGENIKQYIDTAIHWPDWYTPFFKGTGAGRGTLAALATGKIGTPENPVNYNTVIRGKPTIGPNGGCGGAMRVTPFAFQPKSEKEIVDLAIRSTAITHGMPEAQAASAAVALMVHYAYHGLPTDIAAYQAIDRLEDYRIKGQSKCCEAFEAAVRAAQYEPLSCKTVNALPQKLGFGHEDEFLAIPVLSQVFYGALIAEDVRQKSKNDQSAFLQTLAYCATISGDSDSVASMVGNILGAAWGTKALPQKLLGQLQNRQHIEAAAHALHTSMENIYEPA